MEFRPSLSSRHTFKCLILGDSGVGKSTFLRRHATGQFEDQHVPTHGLNVHTLLVETNYQAVALEMWDIAGDSRHGGLHNGYFFFARCAIIMFDLSVASTAASVTRWQQRLEEICDNDLPVVVCGNKAELERMCPELLFRQQANLDYCELSARAAWNLAEPLQLLCRRLLMRKDLKLISQPTLKPVKDCDYNEAAMKEQMDSVIDKMLPPKIKAAETCEPSEVGDFKRFIVLNES
ncbi:GTP-binding nuclear protein Ran, testis-specific isoform-like [Drosophila montana]|uniref:GTP-binding nuclear protein Ran, testis-specific isoform-like n=1 Tax=Drosophila montana TaxID=40370 RepID=UPI00313DE292